MTTILYLTPLPEIDATSSQSSTAANISSQGLLQESGVATERIATDSVGNEISGKFNPGGQRFAEKLANELRSLGESTYASVPLYDPDDANNGPERGYYEISDVEVNPAKPGLREVFEYTATLSQTGSQNSHWRAVTTNAEPINTGLATGSGGLLGIPASATKPQWFTPADGSEEATPVDTVSAEFGDVDRFDPTDSSFTDPTLLFEVPYTDEGNVDVRVYDDRGLPKFYTFNDGTTTVDINQWTHAYHDGFEFDGDPVVDNGLIRLRFDETNGVVEVFEWNDGNQTWDAVTLDHGNLVLVDADITKIGPAEVEAFVLFRNTVTGARSSAFVLLQRGIDGVTVRRDGNYGAIGSSVIGRMVIGTGVIGDGTIEDVFAPVASDQTTDLQPAQRLRARSDT